MERGPLPDLLLEHEHRIEAFGHLLMPLFVPRPFIGGDVKALIQVKQALRRFEFGFQAQQPSDRKERQCARGREVEVGLEQPAKVGPMIASRRPEEGHPARFPPLLQHPPTPLSKVEEVWSPPPSDTLLPGLRKPIRKRLPDLCQILLRGGGPGVGLHNLPPTIQHAPPQTARQPRDRIFDQVDEDGE